MPQRPAAHSAFDRALSGALREAARHPSRFGRELFSSWFRKRGQAHFFLFKKNLSQTNIQFAELIALLRTHISRRGAAPLGGITCLAFNDFITSLDELARTVGPGAGSRGLVRLFSTSYRTLLEQTVLIEPFYGSMTVFLPPHLQINARKIVAEAGYIHSYGRNVYTRSLNDATEEALVDAIAKRLSESPSRQPLFCTVYAHEDFTKGDRSDEKQLRSGLDDVKVFIEKYHLGDQTFVQCLERLRRKFDRRLVIPPPGDFRETHAKLRTAKACDPDRTLWLIVDRGISPGFRPAAERFLICYDQIYKNESVFALFDENKPAWVNHTTAPHALTAAMINIARPWLPRKRARLCDPFGGTGTTWLEATKLEGIRARTSDVKLVSRLLIRDNLDILSMSSAQSARVIRDLAGVQDSLEKGGIRGPAGLTLREERYRNAYDGAMNLLDDCVYTDGNVDVPDRLVNRLQRASLLSRILFYVALRARIRHGAALLRRREEWRAAYLDELSSVYAQLEKLKGLRSVEERSRVADLCEGDYSMSCVVPRKRLVRAKRQQRHACSKADAGEDIGGPYELIVADPPYGFNTREELTELAGLYSRCLRVMVRSLTDGGQLVLCLPELSYTGRRIPSFVTRGWVTQQLLAEAQKLGLQAIMPAQVVPNPGELFRVPFYWESERALRRNVVHFRFVRPRS